MVVYRTKTGSDISYTNLNEHTSKDPDDNSQSTFSADDDSNSTSMTEPKISSSNLTPEETVSFIKTIMSATNEATDAVLQKQQQQEEGSGSGADDDRMVPPSSSSIVITTIQKRSDTKLGMVLGQKENQQLCIVSITPNSVLRNTPLQDGMEVLSMNNIDCRNLDSPAAAQLVKNAVGILTIVARHPNRATPG
jgi:hypothetical protein